MKRIGFPPNVHYWTKDQFRVICSSWNTLGDLPTRKKPRVITFEGKRPNRATITVHDQKSTYGKTLYRCEFSNI